MRSTTSRSERRSSPLIVGGGAGVALLLAGYLIVGGESGGPSPPAVPPAPSPPAAPSAVAAPPPPPPATSADGLRLHGVAGAGAIIGMGDGGQRFVAVGRDVRPGLLLAGVGMDHALLRSGETTYRLGFEGVAAGASTASAGAPDRAAGLREETLRYRLALAPVTERGRITGHAVRDGASLPVLARAGLRSGDVIRRVNGADFDAERLEELAWTLANTGQTTVEIVRDGQPMEITVRQ